MNLFKHEELYRGDNFRKVLTNKQITVCGAGAIGSNLVETLVRVGFAKIKVVDFDRVTGHNVSTQVYGLRDVGALKVDVLRSKLFRDVGVEIEQSYKKVTESNVRSILKGSYLVVDCFDNSASRKIIQDECRDKKIHCLHSGLWEDFGQVTWDQFYKIPRNTDGDVCDYPLARNIILLVVAITAEEILDFCLSIKPRLGNWTVTLKDLSIQRIY